MELSRLLNPINWEEYRRREILDWVCHESIGTTVHDQYQEQRVPESGTWFLRSPEFQDWVENNGAILLFCHGIRMPLSSHNWMLNLIRSWGWKDHFDVLFASSPR